MKRLLILCLVVTLFTCKKEPKIDYAIISGKIENPADKIVTIYFGSQKVTEIPLKEDGTFADTLIIENGYYNFSHGRDRSTLYLSQGNDIKVSLNAKEFDATLVYSGKGSKNNNF